MDSRLVFMENTDTTLELLECARCHTPKPKSAFRPDKRYRSGFNSWCKQCFLDRKKERRLAKRNGVPYDRSGSRRPMVNNQYQCFACGDWKSLDSFFSSKTKCGKSSYCKDCERHKAMAFRLEDPERYKQVKQRCAEKRRLYSKESTLKKLYGITLEQYNVLLEVQNGKCAICGATKDQNDKKRDLCVDHNHATNRVRGLLCGNCNRGVGYFKENVDRMKAAISYLENHRE